MSLEALDVLIINRVLTHTIACSAQFGITYKVELTFDDSEPPEISQRGFLRKLTEDRKTNGGR